MTLLWITAAPVAAALTAAVWRVRRANKVLDTILTEETPTQDLPLPVR
ncbi:hypothetical protein [Actinokineospora bangkokensis]|nr:hypothetical protein [Actinokineospora bangkokensis]